MRRFCNELGKHLFIWSVLVFAFFPLYVTFAISVKNNKQFNQQPFAPLALGERLVVLVARRRERRVRDRHNRQRRERQSLRRGR